MADFNSPYKKEIDRTENPITTDEALQLCGGFGIFQYFTFIVFCLSFWIGGQVVYIIHFMQAHPKYQCILINGSLDQSFECTPSDFCDNGALDWRIDWTSPDSMNNFIVSFNMHCASKF